MGPGVIVVDASALVNMLLYADDRGRKARAVLGRDTEWAAPEHLAVSLLPDEVTGREGRVYRRPDKWW